MATTIRQEINFLNGTITADADANEKAQINTNQYSGSSLYYFEVVGKRASGTCTVTLHDASNTVMATCTVTGTTDALVRSNAFSPTAGAATYHVNLAGSSTTPVIKAARVVVLQTSTPLTATETQIEIGGRFSSTSTTGTANGAPKYWKYTAANWDGTLTVYVEAVFKGNTTKSYTQVILQVADGSGDGFVNWANVTNGTLQYTGTTVTLTRGTSAVTLVDGRNYRIVALTQTTKSACDVYCAKIVIVQYAIDQSQASLVGGDNQIYGGSGTQEAFSQSFVPSVSNLQGVIVYSYTIGSPTDNMVVDIRSSHGAASLASAVFSCALLGSVTEVKEILFLFSPSLTVTVGDTYYLEVTRSGARDTTNNPTVRIRTTTDNYAFGISERRDSGVWAAVGYDLYFKTLGAPFTKLESQYLLANTTFAAGTALQTFLTKWDSTEWAGVTNTYYHYVSAANGSTSDAQLEQADAGGTVTNSEVANPDNGGISAAMTMPASENLDVKATTNNSDLYSSRIVVACVVQTGSSVATWDGLARASWETVMGLAAASVATVDGLARVMLGWKRLCTRYLAWGGPPAKRSKNMYRWTALYCRENK